MPGIFLRMVFWYLSTLNVSNKKTDLWSLRFSKLSLCSAFSYERYSNTFLRQMSLTKRRIVGVYALVSPHCLRHFPVKGILIPFYVKCLLQKDGFMEFTIYQALAMLCIFLWKVFWYLSASNVSNKKTDLYGLRFSKPSLCSAFCCERYSDTFLRQMSPTKRRIYGVYDSVSPHYVRHFPTKGILIPFCVKCLQQKDGLIWFTI